MMKLRNNQGLTLVELMVAIAVGTLTVLAVTTVMLLGLRIYNNSNREAKRQQDVRMAITMMEKLAAEASDVAVLVGTKEVTSSGVVILEWVEENHTIVTGAGVTVLENVSSFEPEMKDDLLTITFTVEGNETPYTFSVCCPVTQLQVAQTFSLRRELSDEEVVTMAIQDEALTPAVRAFLKVLTSQVDSDGRILTEDGAGEYYSSWYIGGYESNPEWNEQTPWCGCFVSWAMEECRGYIQGQTPKFANVDKMWIEFVTADRLNFSDPKPGEIIFLDWIPDEEENVEHVGVVLMVTENRVYTIEGNSNDSVQICNYSLESPYILGYGQINWT